MMLTITKAKMIMMVSTTMRVSGAVCRDCTKLRLGGVLSFSLRPKLPPCHGRPMRVCLGVGLTAT